MNLYNNDLLIMKIEYLDNHYWTYTKNINTNDMTIKKFKL